MSLPPPLAGSSAGHGCTCLQSCCWYWAAGLQWQPRLLLADHPLCRSSHKSDALLSCPLCFTTLCIDCQQHAVYDNQFRAMFVMNCR